MERTDEHIAADVQHGDTESFGLLVERYEDKMLRYGRRFLSDRDDIEDLVQTVFIKAYTNIQSFNATRRFSPWLYRIAHNAFVNALRNRRLDILSMSLDTLFPQPVAKESADVDALSNEMQTALDTCLERLNAKYREPLILHYLQELSYDEISDILRIPVSTVGVRLHRGRTMLRRIYEQKES